MRLARTILSAALLASVSCSDSTAPSIALTDQEVAQLFMEISEAMGDPTGAGRAPNGAFALTTTTMSTTVECLGGGTVGLNGTMVENTTTFTLDVTETFNACRTETFTIGGSLRLIATINAPDEETLTLHETLKGTLTVTHEDGRTGSCALDVTVDLSVSGENVTATASGTICGRSAEVVASTLSG
jgi:hypothetical protein